MTILDEYREALREYSFLLRDRAWVAGMDPAFRDEARPLMERADYIDALLECEVDPSGVSEPSSNVATSDEGRASDA